VVRPILSVAVSEKVRSVKQLRELAQSIRERLEDPDLSVPSRYRWEGALAVLEAVLGEGSTQIDLDLNSLL
jgi:hypothetical protein